MRHRRQRIEFGGPGEKARGFVMIETVNEREPLIEELLGGE